MLRRGVFVTGHENEELGVKDVRWLTPSGADMGQEQWTDDNTRCIGAAAGRSRTRERHSAPGFERDPAAGAERASRRGRIFAAGTARWSALAAAVVDTNRPDFEELEDFKFGHPYLVTGRSLLLLVLRPERGGNAILSMAEAALTAGTAPPRCPDRAANPERGFEV